MLVSVIVPARSWDSHLERTLESISRQILPEGISTEVVVALAGAQPTRSIPDGVTVIANPSGTIPSGLNLAIAASSGEIVARVDARCDLPPIHIARIVDRLADPSIGCVGGSALVLDRGLFGSTYAVAFNSPLLGPTVYRYRLEDGPVDAAYLGAWRRTDLVALGGFDERLIRNQDNELADRVRESGKIVWYDSKLVVGYHNARDLRGAMLHHHEFGLWRMIQREQGQRALTGRHVLALAGGVAGALAGLAAVSSARTRRVALATGAVGYAVAAGGAWRTASRLRRARPDIEGPPFDPLAPVLAPALAALLDVAWIGGILRGGRRAGHASAKPDDRSAMALPDRAAPPREDQEPRGQD